MAEGRWHRRRSLRCGHLQPIKNEDGAACHIPFDIIQEHIHPRLPPRSLHKFRSVCKRWKASIDSEDFIQSQLEKSRRRPIFFAMGSNRRRKFPTTKWGEIYPVEEEEEEDDRSDHVCSLRTKRAIMGILSSIPVDRFIGAETFHLESSLDGLLCFSRELNNLWGDFAVINPVTGFAKLLPPCQVDPYICEILHDPISKEYKVLVASFGYYDWNPSLPASGSVIFTLNSDHSWRQLCDDGYLHLRRTHSFECDSPSNFARPRANGAVHWMNDEFPFNVVAFDIHSEKFSTIRQPEIPPEEYVNNICLAEYAGNLCLIHLSSSLEWLDFWVLTDYEKRTWTLEQRDRFDIFERRTGAFLMSLVYLGLNRVGEIVLLLTLYTMTIRNKRKAEMVTLCYNPCKLGKLRAVKTIESYNRDTYAIVKYVESLLSPVNNISAKASTPNGLGLLLESVPF